MNSILLLVVGLSAFATGYLVYSRYLARRIYRLDPDFRTPAHEFEDGLDYLPTNRHVLFGHHFTSVAGAAPIVGPAIAVIWGWLPAFLWVVLGTIFAGAVHDFGALWISARNRGESIGTLTQGILGRRARTLFLLIILFLIIMVSAVFCVLIANLFMSNPGSVIPVWGELPIAVAVGLLIYKTKAGIFWPSIAALVTLYVLIWAGQFWQPEMIDLFGFTPTSTQFEAAGGDLAAARELARTDGVRASWIVVILAYCFAACLLPVWLLLQPRDYINSHQLFVALGLIFLGVLVTNAPLAAPAINAAVPADTPGWFPLLFITIACGAISGFHGLVASGTSSKQLDRESDARYVGYGGAIGEGTLALTSIVACTAGFAAMVGRDAWNRHYSSFASAASGGVQAFVQGVGHLAAGIGIPQELAVIFAAVVVISFAATSLDTAFRILRYILQELGSQYRVAPLQNGTVATLVGVFLTGLLALGVDRGAGGMRLWPLFGTTNQLVGALTLLVVTSYLLSLGRKAWVTALPMVFLFFITTWGMVLELDRYLGESQWLLFGFGAAIFALEIWLILEAVVALRRLLGRRPPAPGPPPEKVAYQQGVAEGPQA
ncbi:MAG: carbon starvation CstA family protein [Longimicrobiaceae bacterium]